MTLHTLPRVSYGSDWGTKRRLIAAKCRAEANPSGVPMLFIVPGHYYAHGARGFGRDYARARLILSTPEPGRRPRDRDLAKGRVTRETLLANANLIDEAFGPGTAERLSLKETLWIEETA